MPTRPFRVLLPTAYLFIVFCGVFIRYDSTYNIECEWVWLLSPHISFFFFFFFMFSLLQFKSLYIKCRIRFISLFALSSSSKVVLLLHHQFLWYIFHLKRKAEAQICWDIPNGCVRVGAIRSNILVKFFWWAHKHNNNDYRRNTHVNSIWKTADNNQWTVKW